MTYEQYWDGEAELTKFYAEAYEMKREQDALDLWVLGNYFYEALLCASPVLRASFSKTQHKPIPFTEDIYPLTNAMAEKQEKDRQRKAAQAAIDHMFEVMKRNNRRITRENKEKGGNTDA